MRAEAPLRDEFGGGGGGGGASAPTLETSQAPQEFLDEMAVIMKWAEANEKDAKRDLFQFWLLKLPAILVTAGAALFAYFKIDVGAIAASAVSAVCIMVDAVRPKGQMYRVHRRAANDIFKLHADMASQFRAGKLNHRELTYLAGGIISESKKERDRITKYVTDAESTLAEPTTPLT
ncbi:MAG TPA: hypothetical protein VN902_03105 [Candidatus Acidoferrales bacterium]|nr:hypothetical protein [Candidatus Acidoferrales bacterium]